MDHPDRGDPVLRLFADVVLDASVAWWAHERNETTGGGIDRRALLAGSAGAAGRGSARAFAQAAPYPNRPIRVIVPFAAGGPSDIIARIVADALYPQLGQTLVIDNRAGGGANIGIGLAARAEPDGYTLLITTSAFVINPSLYKKIPFDPIKDFSPISDLAISPQMLSVMPGYVNTLAEFIAKAKGSARQAQLFKPRRRHPGAIDGRAVEAARGHRHRPRAVLRRPAGGAGVAERIGPVDDQCGSDQPEAGAGGHHPALAVSGKSAYFALPKVPTLVESGYPGFVTDTFVGFFAPAGTPQAVIDRLASATRAVLTRQDVIERARGAGFEITAGGPEVLAKRVVNEVAFNRDIIQKAGIEPR